MSECSKHQSQKTCCAPIEAQIRKPYLDNPEHVSKGVAAFNPVLYSLGMPNPLWARLREKDRFKALESQGLHVRFPKQNGMMLGLESRPMVQDSVRSPVVIEPQPSLKQTKPRLLLLRESQFVL